MAGTVPVKQRTTSVVRPESRHREFGHRRFALASAVAVGLTAITPLAVLPATAATSTAASSASTFPEHHRNSASSRLPVFGERGPHVTALQQALLSRGIALRGGADGIFGGGTRTAVAAFQTTVGLVASGLVDVTTAHLLGLADQPPLPTRGQRGESVRRLQNALVSRGVSVNGGVDGIFGAGTAAAVAAFQTSRGLNPTGIVDISTAVALGVAPGNSDSTGSLPGTTTPVTSAPVTTTPVTTIPVTTTPASVSPTWPTRGQRGDAVRVLQSALVTAGVTLVGGVDGVFGSATSRAISDYQRTMQLGVTGVVDSWTARLLGISPAPVWPSMGQRSDDVRGLQRALIAAGVNVTGGADGIFGNATTTAVRNFQQRRGLTSTGIVDLHTAALLRLTDPAPTSTPATTTPATTTPATTTPVTVSVFPVQGPCWFTDTWMAPRSGGRKHEGVDIIAKTGNLIYAVVDGTITRQFWDRPGSLGGNALRLTAADGTYFHYAHLSAFAEGIGVGVSVIAGQVIGYVGSTGSSSTPHLHFEHHPGGGAAVNPFPTVKAINGCRSTTPLPQPGTPSSPTTSSTEPTPTSVAPVQ